MKAEAWTLCLQNVDAVGWKGILPVKTSVSKSLLMAVNVSRQAIVKGTLWATPPAYFKKNGMQSFLAYPMKTLRITMTRD